VDENRLFFLYARLFCAHPVHLIDICRHYLAYCIANTDLGYNFKSLKDISPYLEPTTAGISSLWARTTALKYECLVVVGYPEKVDVSYKWPTSPEYYNSAIIVNNDGETIGNYRKTHLYYTDETWALEGNYGFYESHIRGLGNVAVGICMDLKYIRQLFLCMSYANYILQSIQVRSPMGRLGVWLPYPAFRSQSCYRINGLADSRGCEVI
jgi:hypothetical protein